LTEDRRTPVRTPKMQLNGFTCSPSNYRHRRGSESRRHRRKHSSTGHNLNRPTESPSKRAYGTGQPSESDRLGPACAGTQTRAKSGSLDGLGPSPQIHLGRSPTAGDRRRAARVRKPGGTWEWTAGPEQPARSQSTAQARSPAPGRQTSSPARARRGQLTG
jgi:hypothetical protein